MHGALREQHFQQLPVQHLPASSKGRIASHVKPLAAATEATRAWYATHTDARDAQTFGGEKYNPDDPAIKIGQRLMGLMSYERGIEYHLNEADTPMAADLLTPDEADLVVRAIEQDRQAHDLGGDIARVKAAAATHYVLQHTIQFEQ